MADAILDFPERFHSLQGEQIHERKKNFSKLLRDPAFQSNSQQFYIMLKNLETKNNLEELFKIDSLIYFKRSAELLEILRNGTNEIFLRKIIKQHWFIEEAFKDISAEEFVSDFLPCLSYSIQMKLLKRVSVVWDESKMDVLFDYLLKCYGLAVAKTILHKCSSYKIPIVLEEHEIKLNPNQVKCVFDKNIDLFLKYLQHHKKISNSIYNENKVIDYVALKDPKLFLDLEDSNIITFKNLGRRKSKKVFNYVKLQIAKDVEKYTHLLNKAVIVRKLGNEFPNVYQSIFPRKIEDINNFNMCHRLLQLYPKNKRWELLVNTFTTKFSNRDIADLFLKIHGISKLNPDRVSIQNWAVAHYTSTNSEKYLKYYDLSKSIIMIKDKINVTSDMYKRETLVTLLIAACAENKDLIALEDVLKYICVRHRNEESCFRYQILRSLCDSFKVEEFNENHWKYINEQLKLLRIQNGYRSCDNQIFVKYLEYLFKHAKPITDGLLQFINDVIEHNCSFVLNLQNPEVESLILIKLAHIVPNVINKDNKDYGTYYAKLINYIVDFNFENIRFAVNLNNFSYLIDYIKIIFEKGNKFTNIEYGILKDILLYNTNFPSIAISIKEATVLKVITTISLGDNGVPIKVYQAMLLKENRSHLENDVLKFYFENVEIWFDNTIINWFLINEPNTIVPYFNGILKNNLETCLIGYKSLKYLKYYSHIGLDKAVYEFFTNQVDKITNTSKDTIISVINNLRLLLSTDEFITIVNKYFLPKKIKLDPDDEEMSKFYKVQCKILEQFHRVNEPSKILSVIMQFNQGDYLKFAVPALYSTFYRSPEQQLKVHLKILSSRALSVKKHALFLACDVMNQTLVLKMLTEAKLSNKSGQKHVFSSILKYFLKNPSQELFNLVIENVNTINENDSENLEYLQSVHIPRKYKPLYIEKCWEFYESLEKYGVKYKNYLNNFLRTIVESTTQIVTCLSSNFVNRIVDVYFKTLDKELECDTFIVFVLKYRVAEQASNFNVVFQILANFPPGAVHRFFTNFFDNNIEKTNRDFVQIFTEYWNITFSVIDTFQQSISLKLLCFNHCSTSMEMYAQYIVNYMDQLMKEFGYHIFNIFMLTLKLIVNKEKEKINKYLLCLSILKIKCSADTSILVLGILNESYYEHTEEISSVYNEIMNILKNVDDMAVRVYYRYYSDGDVSDCDS